MPKVTMIPPTKPDESGKIRVGAYCRVSTSTTEQHNSFLVQTEYYQNKFQHSETEILVEIYADEGESGVSDKRENFQRMMKDCHRGRIDRIYTKSISRFARNTKDCLQYLRELKAIGVTVVFEKERLDTALLSDEMMLTIMSGLAQEESVSLSKNFRWGIQKRMQNGTYKMSNAPYGYVLTDGKLVISEPEAEVVRQIFAWYLDGYGVLQIMNMLNQAGIPTSKNLEKWGKAHVRYILDNEKYTGDSVYQKNYTTDTVPFKVKKNYGQKPMYYVSGTHEGIISKEVFEKAKALTVARRKVMPYTKMQYYPLTRKMICPYCGKKFGRSTKKKSRIFWVCDTHHKNAESCPNLQIEQCIVYDAFIQMFNKLYFHYQTILLPVRQNLLELKGRMFSKNAHISDIQTKIANLREQNHVLATLVTKGFLSSEKYQEQSAGLQTKITKLQKELFRLTRSDEDDTLEQLDFLIEYFESRQEKMIEFEEDVFSTLVDKVITESRSRLTFCLAGGLQFTEYIYTDKE